MKGPSAGPAEQWEGTGQKQKEQGQNWGMVQEGCGQEGRRVRAESAALTDLWGEGGGGTAAHLCVGGTPRSISAVCVFTATTQGGPCNHLPSGDETAEAQRG